MPKRRDRVVKCRPHGMSAEPALRALRPVGAPAIHRGRAIAARLVAQVVAVAHERIDRAHGIALLAFDSRTKE